MPICDSAVRASTHFRDLHTCPHPDSAPHSDCCCYPGCDQGKCSSFTFKSNIVFVRDNSTFVGKAAPGPGLNNFTFEDNIYWTSSSTPPPNPFNGTGTGSGESFPQWQAAEKDADSLVQDPQFSNISSYQLSPSSPALKLGFKPIDMSKVGPFPAHADATEPVCLIFAAGLRWCSAAAFFRAWSHTALVIALAPSRPIAAGWAHGEQGWGLSCMHLPVHGRQARPP